MPLSSPAFTCSNVFFHHESFTTSFVSSFTSPPVFVNQVHFTEHFYVCNPVWSLTVILE